MRSPGVVMGHAKLAGAARRPHDHIARHSHRIGESRRGGPSRCAGAERQDVAIRARWKSARSATGGPHDDVAHRAHRIGKAGVRPPVEIAARIHRHDLFGRAAREPHRRPGGIADHQIAPCGDRGGRLVGEEP
jgi:hypothetical protein